MTLSIISKETFQNHLAQVTEASFMQTPEMATLLQKRGYQTDYIAYLVEGQPVVSAILYSIPMTGGSYLEINSGPIVTDERYLSDFYRDLQDYAKKQKALELVVKPYHTYQTFDSEGQPTSEERTDYLKLFRDLGYAHDGLQTGYPGGEPDWHYVKDLTGLTPQSLTASFDKKGKALLKKAHTFGITLRRLNREELPAFKDITSATSDRRDYTDKPLDYYQDLYDSFGDKAEFMLASLNFQDYLDNLCQSQEQLHSKIDQLTSRLAQQPQSTKMQNTLRELKEQSKTFDTRKQEAHDLIRQYGQTDVDLAASLFLYTQKESTYLFSGSYPAFNKFYAPALLQEYMMTQSITRGIATYNLLGITGVFDGSDGVLHFKQNFNGHIVRKMGTFRYYPHPLKYKFIQVIKKLLRR